MSESSERVESQHSTESPGRPTRAAVRLSPSPISRPPGPTILPTNTRMAPASTTASMPYWRTRTVDVVDICLPHHLHTGAIIAAAKAGKAILCEKPLCTSLEDARLIEAALNENGVIFMMAHNQLFQPTLIEARRLLRARHAGHARSSIRSIEVFQHRGWAPGKSRPTAGGESPWAWRADISKMGGGEVLDTGWHATYRLLALAGDDRRSRSRR